MSATDSVFQSQAMQREADQSQSNPVIEPADQRWVNPVDTLVNTIDRVFIVAYREDTTQLEAAIAQAGFQYEVSRQEDKPEYQGTAAAYRCLMNHYQVWQKAAQASCPTLIVEADFVPVVGLGQLPLPFSPSQENAGIAWLYTCAPQIYNVSAEGFIQGFSTALVAYILTPKAAASLAGLVDEVTQRHQTGYSTFDSEIDRFLLKQGFKNYIGFRNYGEHGGRSNPEHRRNGFSGIHRADILYNQLAFMPQYVEAGEQLHWARLRARIKGIGRLLTGRLLRPAVVKKSSTPLRMISTAIRRQLSVRL